MKQHYDKPVYWRLPDDGAKFKCSECEDYFNHNEVLLTQIPIDDSRKTLCFECIDEDWLKNATNLGLYKY